MTPMPKSLKKEEIERNITINEDGIEIKIKRSDEEFCLVESIEVNGHSCYFFDLGTMKDFDVDHAPVCGCGDRRFVPKAPTLPLLANLNMTEDEYAVLMKILEKHLFVGRCKRCI